MKKSLRYGVLFCLLSGLSAIAVDIESPADNWNAPVVSQTLDTESADDSGEASAVNHNTDLPSETLDHLFVICTFPVKKIVLPPWRIDDCFICSIWQPPKPA